MTYTIDLWNDSRHENNKLRFLIEMHNEDADRFIRPLILICTSGSFFFMIKHLASIFEMSTPLTNSRCAR